MSREPKPKRPRWLNRTVLGIGLASLFSDRAHEVAITALPAFLATKGVAAAWLGRGVRTARPWAGQSGDGDLRAAASPC